MAYVGKTHFLDTPGSGNEWSNLLSRYSWGAPVGNVLWVSSGTGTNGTGYGFSPASPLASLDYALGLTKPNNHDYVLLLPNHVETLTAAGSSLGNGGVFAGNTLSAGVTVQGLGNGRERPTFNYTTAIGASFNVSAANFTIRNCVFTPTGFSAITAAMNVTAADFTMDGCEWQISTGTNAPVLGILTAATAARFRVVNSLFKGPATSTDTCTACIKHEVGIDFDISNNFFIGKLTQAVLNATTILGGRITGNFAHIYTGTKAFALAAGTTGVGTNNRIVVPSGTAPVVGAGFSWTANQYTTEALTIGTPTALAF